MHCASEIEAKDTSEPEHQNSFGPFRCHRRLSASDKNYKNCIPSVCAIVHIVLSLVKFIFPYFCIKKRFCPRKACIFNILYTVRILNFSFCPVPFCNFQSAFQQAPVTSSPHFQSDFGACPFQSVSLLFLPAPAPSLSPFSTFRDVFYKAQSVSAASAQNPGSAYPHEEYTIPAPDR